jgi:hypothetical protein
MRIRKYILSFTAGIVIMGIVSGCSVLTAKVALTLAGAAATTVAGVYKYKGDQEKAAAIINFRDEVRGDLAIIKKELEKNQ